jgi:hypothetical protein
MPAYIGEGPISRAVREQRLTARRGVERGSASGPPPAGGADVSTAHHHELELPDTGLTTRDLSRATPAAHPEDRALKLGAGLVLIGLGCLIVFAGVLQIVELKQDVKASARDAAAARELLELQRGGGR